MMISSNLYDSLTDINKSASISANIGYLIKYNAKTISKKVGIQIINIFQKASRTLDYSNLVWLTHSLWLGLQSEYVSSKELIKSCLTFLIINHFKLKDFSREVYSFISYILVIKINSFTLFGHILWRTLQNILPS